MSKTPLFLCRSQIVMGIHHLGYILLTTAVGRNIATHDQIVVTMLGDILMFYDSQQSIT